MIVVDTSVWIAKLRQDDTPATRFLEALRNEDELVIGDIVVLEVLQGIDSERNAARLENWFLDYGITPMLNEQVALAAARNFRALRRKGITVRKTPDLVIGTFCLLEGHQLLHQDRDFDHFETYLGLKTFRPN